MPAAKTFWFRTATVGSVTAPTNCWLLSETVGTGADDTTTIHTGNNNSASWQLLKPGVSQGTTGIVTSGLPVDTPPATANRFGWFSDKPYSGTFLAGTWTASMSQNDTTNSTGVPNINVYSSTTQDFTGTFALLFSIIGGTSWWTNNTSTVTATNTPSVITLTNQYIFCNVWCHETAAISAKSHSFHVNGTASSKIVSPTFIPFTSTMSMMGCGI
jgi:hypothetical protein